MTLATKNGSLIVKNGSLAESCGCCGDGGWVCCGDPACYWQTYDVKLTISRDVGPWVPIAESPYVGSFVLPYVRLGEIRNTALNRTDYFFREWKLTLPISEACVTPEATFAVRWGAWFASMDFTWSVKYNLHHIFYGNTDACIAGTKGGGEAFVNGCGIGHSGPILGSTESRPGRHSFSLGGSARVAMLFFEFINRE